MAACALADGAGAPGCVVGVAGTDAAAQADLTGSLEAAARTL